MIDLCLTMSNSKLLLIDKSKFTVIGLEEVSPTTWVQGQTI